MRRSVIIMASGINLQSVSSMVPPPSSSTTVESKIWPHGPLGGHSRAKLCLKSWLTYPELYSKETAELGLSTHLCLREVPPFSTIHPAMQAMVQSWSYAINDSGAVTYPSTSPTPTLPHTRHHLACVCNVVHLSPWAVLKHTEHGP